MSLTDTQIRSSSSSWYRVPDNTCILHLYAVLLYITDITPNTQGQGRGAMLVVVHTTHTVNILIILLYSLLITNHVSLDQVWNDGFPPLHGGNEKKEQEGS